MRGVIYTSDSKNSKISGNKKVDATYASIKATCPDTCELKNEGCYAQSSFVGMVNARMNRRARQDSALDLARSEAKCIDESYDGEEVPEGRALRIHVAGDSTLRAGTKLIANAVARWKKRGGGDVWSYTHSHANVPRAMWGSVSVLASVDNIEQVKAARKMGYAPAIVVPVHKSDRAYTLEGSSVKWIPCPNQTRDVSCVDCRLCFDANRLFENNMGIAFAAHGIKQKDLKRRLTVVS